MTFWALPPIIKVYEALGCVADGRIELSGDKAKVYSSSGNKFYTVTFNPDTKEIMCNDNGSFWQGYLGYPAIAFLMQIDLIPYNQKLAELLKNIEWKDINTKYKNDWAKTQEYCNQLVIERGGNLQALIDEITRIYNFLKDNPMQLLGKKTKPPTGY